MQIIRKQFSNAVGSCTGDPLWIKWWLQHIALRQKRLLSLEGKIIIKEKWARQWWYILGDKKPYSNINHKTYLNPELWNFLIKNSNGKNGFSISHDNNRRIERRIYKLHSHQNAQIEAVAAHFEVMAIHKDGISFRFK